MGAKGGNRVDRDELQESFNRVELPFVKGRDESDEAWYACLQYLFMGESRNLLSAFRIFSNRPDAKGASNSFRLWSKKFKWPDSAEQFDKARTKRDKAIVKKAIANVSRGTKFDYSGIFEELRRLVVEDLQVDVALQQMLTLQMEQIVEGEADIKLSRLKDLVMIRKELLNGRKMAIEQAAAIYGFGIVSGTEGVVEATIVDESV